MLFFGHSQSRRVRQAISYRCFLRGPASGHASLISGARACCGICVVHSLRSLRAGEMLAKEWTTHMGSLANVIAQKAVFPIVIVTPTVIGNGCDNCLTIMRNIIFFDLCCGEVHEGMGLATLVKRVRMPAKATQEATPMCSTSTDLSCNLSCSIT